ncbi:hypothetical protein MPER_01177, partial [Moniliophthora perniciosa FA553]
VKTYNIEPRYYHSCQEFASISYQIDTATASRIGIVASSVSPSLISLPNP